MTTTYKVGDITVRQDIALKDLDEPINFWTPPKRVANPLNRSNPMWDQGIASRFTPKDGSAVIIKMRELV